MYENINLKIGERIKFLRKNKNISQETLANMADIERGYMTGVESGKRNVSVKVLSKIITALDTSFSDFFNYKEFVK
jgi:transcriptional regulator with XRE-family HTH domain